MTQAEERFRDAKEGLDKVIADLYEALAPDGLESVYNADAVEKIEACYMELRSIKRKLSE
ncbi:hypothetical protein [Larkinella ripae]